MDEKVIKVCLMLTEDGTFLPPLKTTHFCFLMWRANWDEKLKVKHNVENAIKNLENKGLVDYMQVEGRVPPSAKGDEIRATLLQQGYMMAQERYPDSPR